MFDYATLSALAKRIKRPVRDLLALSCDNDPFYAGRQSRVRDGKWFAELWRNGGYVPGYHIRRIHYRIIHSKIPTLKPDGVVYQNTDPDWGFLAAASLDARY